MFTPLVRLFAMLAVSATPAIYADSFIDSRDGRDYTVVPIGGLVWMAQNLAYVTPNSWCYDDQLRDCDANGRLYTWAAALTACPIGWRLATDEDWIGLEMSLGMTREQASAVGPRGTDIGAQLRAGGESEFNAPISGYRRPDGSYARRGERAAYWTASSASEDDAWHRDIRSSVDTVYRSPVTKTYALSIRCVRTKHADR
jgi:uncharacterized protein (TIGR02145 family)